MYYALSLVKFSLIFYYQIEKVDRIKLFIYKIIYTRVY